MFFLIESEILKNLSKLFFCKKNKLTNINITLKENKILNENLLDTTDNLEKQKNNTNDKNISIKIINLTKIYKFCCKKDKYVLNNINLTLRTNEKFGLLGFNGTGKSTLIKILINEIDYDNGEIYLFNKEFKSNFKLLKNIIGYCPQIDFIFDNFTVNNILSFYKNLKKIPLSIEELSKKYGLEKYLNTKCENLSGGNKRKLNFALSIMNNPKLLLLDEPTTGVDPLNRKKICENILNLKHKYNMILVTQSTEEAELLCDTISWLKNGNFECIGNSEKLKLIYSVGYFFQLKIKNDDDNNNNNNCNELYNKLESKMKNCDKLDDIIKNDYNYLNKLNIIFDSIKDYYKYVYINEFYIDNYSIEFIIKVNEGSEKELFSRILNLKNDFNFIEEFSIRMESLENILMNIK